MMDNDPDPYEDLLLIAVLRESQDIQHGVWFYITTRDSSSMDASVRQYIQGHAEETRRTMQRIIDGIAIVQRDMSRGGT